MTIFSAALLLFLVMDPFGNIPFFLAELNRVDSSRQVRVVIRELLFALAALVVFLFLGQSLLRILGISEPALTIAGGTLLFLISVRMVFPPTAGAMGEALQGEPFLVPLAIPYVAGPSALSSVLLIMNREPERWPAWLVALGLAWAATSVILLLASSFRRLLGKRGLIALERLMGMILVAISVQMVLDGVREAYRAWPGSG